MGKNPQAICRVCLQYCKRSYILLEDFLPLNEEEAESKVTYAEAYMCCTQLEVQVGADGFPEWLCKTCCLDLQNAYNFRRKAKESFEKLSCIVGNWKSVSLREESAKTVNKSSDCVTIPQYNDHIQNENKSNLSELNESLQLQTSRSANDFVTNSDNDKPLEQITLSQEIYPEQFLEVIENSVDSVRSSFNDDNVVVPETNSVNGQEIEFSPKTKLFPKGRHECSFCAQSYFTPIGLKAHMELHPAAAKHKETKQSVHTSGNVVQFPFEMEAIATEGMFTCQLCGVQFNEASKFRSHMWSHTGEKRYNCKICENSFSSNKYLQRHMRIHTGERLYECGFCEESFMNSSTLLGHQRRHTGERPYSCNYCDERFISHSGMAAHMKRHHSDSKTQIVSQTHRTSYKCKLCTKHFVLESKLDQHMKQEHDDHIHKPYGSNLCKQIEITAAEDSIESFKNDANAACYEETTLLAPDRIGAMTETEVDAKIEDPKSLSTNVKPITAYMREYRARKRSGITKTIEVPEKVKRRRMQKAAYAQKYRNRKMEEEIMNLAAYSRENETSPRDQPTVDTVDIT